MALIKCEECGHSISSKACFCPNCGCPVTSEHVLNEESKKLELLQKFAEMYEVEFKKIKSKEALNKDQKEECLMFYRICLNVDFFLRSRGYPFSINILKMDEKKSYTENAASHILSYFRYKDVLLDISPNDIYPLTKKMWEIEKRRHIIESAQDENITKLLIKIKRAIHIAQDKNDYEEKEIQKMSEELNKERNDRNEKKPIDIDNYCTHGTGIKCPNCGSKFGEKISVIKKGASIYAWGLLSSDIGKNYYCKSCGYKW